MAEIIKEDIAKIKKLLKDVLGTDVYTSLERLGGLTNHTYHATLEPPYPEDLQVAAWVRCQGEPLDWIYFDHKVKKQYDEHQE